ncbi:MAG: hypothetical protein FJ128_02295 [Deltaproteobacteria bacterium]|nr:hypothetical protein [Deltaproteobacteria bacterium]
MSLPSYVSLVRFASRMMQPLPLRAFRFLGRTLSLLNVHYYRSEYRETGEMLQEFLGLSGSALERTLKGIFYHRALKQLDFWLYPSLTPDTVRRMTCVTPLTREVSRLSEGPILYLGFHLGNQSWYSSVHRLLGNSPLYTVRAESRTEWFNPVAQPDPIIIPGRDTRLLLQQLRAGSKASLVADEFTPDLLRHTVNIQFLGRTLRWPTGFARLAKMAQALCILGLTPRLPDGRVLFDLTPLEPEQSFADPDYVPALVREAVSRLERYVARHPDQWLRWRYLKILQVS